MHVINLHIFICKYYIQLFIKTHLLSFLPQVNDLIKVWKEEWTFAQ
jgi:hypothetical protein